MDDKCMQCGRILTHNEIGLHKRLLGKLSTRFMCISCLARYYDVEESVLYEKIEVFKEHGCTLFE